MANSGGQPATYPKNIRGSFPVVKWEGYEANHSCLFSAEAKNEWSYTFTPTHGRHRGNFTVTDLLQILILILILPPLLLLLLLLFCTLLSLLLLHSADITSRICTVLTFLKVNSISIIMCSYVCDICHTKCHTAGSCGSLVITIKMKTTKISEWTPSYCLKFLKKEPYQSSIMHSFRTLKTVVLVLSLITKSHFHHAVNQFFWDMTLQLDMLWLMFQIHSTFTFSGLLTTKMKVLRVCKMGTPHPMTQCHIQKEFSLQQHQCQNLKPWTRQVYI